MTEKYDIIVVGGGPAGATAAQITAKAGAQVLLLDRAGRIKPCGGAVPPDPFPSATARARTRRPRTARSALGVGRVCVGRGGWPPCAVVAPPIGESRERQDLRRGCRTLRHGAGARVAGGDRVAIITATGA